MAQSSDKHAAVLLQFTDTHLHAALDGHMHGVTTQQTFDAALNHAREDSRWPPDAIVVTGDIVQDESRIGYQRFREAFQDFGLPVFCIPGNHDDPTLMAELLMSPPFQLCGNAKLGDWRLLLLSTFDKGKDGGAIGLDRLAKMEESLSKYSQEHVLICMHHQPLDMGSAWLDGVGLRDAQEFLEVIDRHSHVRGVLWGHVHQASDRERKNVRFLSTPSTCFQFLPDTDTAAIDTRSPGLRWLALESDGKITTEVEWVD
jgi:Icc protein